MSFSAQAREVADMNDIGTAYNDLKVLVIDDEAAIRDMIQEMLNTLGVESITQATDGLSGLEAISQSRPDLVFCDIHMKPVDGQDFLKLVRDTKEKWIHELPIIFLTGDNLLDSVKTASQHHVDGYLVKPIDFEQFKLQIDLILLRINEHTKMSLVSAPTLERRLN
jgi:two-component system chemotaxis response regulator CheY